MMQNTPRLTRIALGVYASVVRTGGKSVHDTLPPGQQDCGVFCRPGALPFGIVS
jgi:hypothetical protein